MVNRIRIILFSLLAIIILAGCSGGGFPLVTEPIDSTTVVRQVQYFDRGAEGLPYEFSVTVPESWVDNFDTTNNGSVVTFRHVTEDGRSAAIFSIHALSFSQFWKQNGSYPQQFASVHTDWDTYWVSYHPQDAFYSGLSEEAYAELSAAVPDIIASFQSTEASAMMMGQ